jgi:O-antigen/teichoic acid export membrane protein
MSENLIKKNVSYTFLYQFILVITPILTLPYLSRTLGAETIGVLALVQSFFIFFNLISTMGSGTVGQKKIAESASCPQIMSEAFRDIITLKILLSLFGTTFYIFIIYISDLSFKALLYVQSIHLITNAIDISWLYNGLENFKKTVVILICIKISAVICVFLFVKSPSDAEIYLMCYLFPNFIGHFFMWKDIKLYIHISDFWHAQPFKYFKSVMILSIAQFAIIAFYMTDKIIIYYFTGVASEVGYYDQALKFIMIGVAVVTAISTILLPRFARLHSGAKTAELQLLIHKAVRLTTMVCVLIALLLFFNADPFLILFLGADYRPSIALLQILSIGFVLKGISAILGSSYLIAVGQNIRFCIVIYSAALTNIIFNYAFISRYSAVGACIATLFCEITLATMLIYSTKNVMGFKHFFDITWRYIIAAVVCSVFMFFVSFIVMNNMLDVIVSSLLLCSVYFSILFILKDITIFELYKYVWSNLKCAPWFR